MPSPAVSTSTSRKLTSSSSVTISSESFSSSTIRIFLPGPVQAWEDALHDPVESRMRASTAKGA